MKKGMSNAETKKTLIEWCENPSRGVFSWPTDACGYRQHIKFVNHRNKNWYGGTEEKFLQFVRDYANTL
jgi:hypothetical protein